MCTGLNPAPLFANSFLQEIINKQYIKKKIKKTDIGRARRSRNVFRFIDDLTVLNDFSDFDRRFQEIYSPECELKKKNLVYLGRVFLDHMITVKNFVQCCLIRWIDFHFKLYAWFT